MAVALSKVLSYGAVSSAARARVRAVISVGSCRYMASVGGTGSRSARRWAGSGGLRSDQAW
jgi:hypothetical protein